MSSTQVRKSDFNQESMIKHGTEYDATITTGLEMMPPLDVQVGVTVMLTPLSLRKTIQANGLVIFFG